MLVPYESELKRYMDQPVVFYKVITPGYLLLPLDSFLYGATGPGILSFPLICVFG